MTGMAVITIDASPATGQDLGGPVPAGTTGPGDVDRSPATTRPGRTVRSWPLLVLAAPAAVEVWSGWIGIAQKTGFGLVRPLPGIWPALHLDTAITLPVGVEAYAAYALRAWLARDSAISARTRRFAKWSTISSFALGMAGQVAYHLIAQAGMARAPWAVTTIVSGLPVLVLGMGTALAHMLRADAETMDAPDNETGPLATSRPLGLVSSGPGKTRPHSTGTGPGPVPGPGPEWTEVGTQAGDGDKEPGFQIARPQLDQARVVARRLSAAGKPVSRRALRHGGVRGSNQALNVLARMLSAELAGCADSG